MPPRSGAAGPVVVVVVGATVTGAAVAMVDASRVQVG